ncbi:hypothetical protein MER72_05930 [Acinetobacter baumannii]|nr:hypothetical protein [Acinetobacter baumannii]
MSLGNIMKGIGTKDWIYIFIISFLLQFVIYYFSFIYGSSGKALGYISFAGTLISIILAVIAIGYTYGESIKQKGSSDQLLLEIAGLREIKEKLAGQVDILENISAIKSAVEDTQITVSKLDVAKHLKEFTKQIELDKNTISNNSNIELSKIEQILMGFPMLSDGYILNMLYAIENEKIDDYIDLLLLVVEHDAESDEWFLLANLYGGIYFICENIGIFRDFKVQDGIKDMYLRKYPKNSDKFKPDSNFGQVVLKTLYAE